MKILFYWGFMLICFLFAFLLLWIFFHSIFKSSSVIFPYALYELDIAKSYPKVWYYIKISYLVFFSTTTFILSNSFFQRLFKNLSFSTPSSSIPTTSLHLYIGIDSITNEKVYLQEAALYQNILITGSIGSGKTSGLMYPFTKQLIQYQCHNKKEKLGILVLDIKGNFYQKILEYVSLYDREDDLVLIGLGHGTYYNPLHKPDLKPTVLANRLKTILTLFSPQNSDSYWIDKSEQVLCEAIKLCRLYNNNYVTFKELHNLVTDETYLAEKLSCLRLKFQNADFSQSQIYDLLSALNFFEHEFKQLDLRVLSILKSEITRITNVFLNDFEVFHTFCCEEKDLTFYGFQELIEKGKIVVLTMNMAKYQDLSRILATYLKLDFQSEVLSTLEKNSSKSCVFISDEFHEYCTTTDANFFSQSREAKCINIVATQSYSSIQNTIKDEVSTKVILQSFINKLWLRTDDIDTIEQIQKLLGKEQKEKTSINITENANKIHYNYLLNLLNSSDSSFSESINTYSQSDYIYDTNFFSQQLENFNCLAFLSDGMHIQKPNILKLIPYFQNLK